MSSEQWIKYAWLDEDDATDDLMAGCVRRGDRAERVMVRQLLAIDEGSRRDATVHEAWQMSESDSGNNVVQVAAIGKAVVTFEPNGWRGVEPKRAVCRVLLERQCRHAGRLRLGRSDPARLRPSSLRQ